MKIESLRNKKIAILWFGKEWKSTLDFLKEIWAENITVFDKDITISKEEWIHYSLWEGYLESLWYYEVIIKSPGISPYNDKIFPYVDRITSQTEIFYDNYPGKIISITATKGKSTTATLTYLTLKKAGFKVKLVWNIWNPVLSEVDMNKEYDYIVYELSSYMLENLNKSDQISILWNIYPDHLDWHNWFDNYSNTKKNVVRWSKYSIVRDFIWIHSENIKTFWESWDYTFLEWNFYVRGNIVFTNRWFKIEGIHNMMNIASVMGVCDILWIWFWALQEVCKEFIWLPHRMEKFWPYSWIYFIDDAISTTPESTIEAIKTYKTDVWVLFLWWLDRGYEFNSLVKQLEHYQIFNLVLFPETSKKIIPLLNDKFNYIETTSMKEGIIFAYKHTPKWKTVMLSTASPSYNLWKNYIEKWEEFKKYAMVCSPSDSLYEKIKNFITKILP